MRKIEPFSYSMKAVCQRAKIPETGVMVVCSLCKEYKTAFWSCLLYIHFTNQDGGSARIRTILPYPDSHWKPIDPDLTYKLNYFNFLVFWMIPPSPPITSHSEKEAKGLSDRMWSWIRIRIQIRIVMWTHNTGWNSIGCTVFLLTVWKGCHWCKKVRLGFIYTSLLLFVAHFTTTQGRLW
jgi:hypothetical protein